MNDLRGGLPLGWLTPLDIFQQGVLKQGRELLNREQREVDAAFVAGHSELGPAEKKATLTQQ